jgi:tRNA pseudouridine55 synthase
MCASQVGHSGTLDPMATGVLPVAIGKATKLIQVLVLHILPALSPFSVTECAVLQYLPHDREYVAGIRLGVTTSSDDVTGSANISIIFRLFSSERRRALQVCGLGTVSQPH